MANLYKALQKLVVSLETRQILLSILLKDKLLSSVILIKQKLKTKMIKIKHQLSASHLVNRITKKMDKKKARKKKNFLYFLIVWAVPQHLFLTKIILSLVILVNKTYSILVKIRKKKMKVKKMIKMMENREVRALPLFKMIMKIRINWIWKINQLKRVHIKRFLRKKYKNLRFQFLLNKKKVAELEKYQFKELNLENKMIKKELLCISYYLKIQLGKSFMTLI